LLRLLTTNTPSTFPFLVLAINFSKDICVVLKLLSIPLFIIPEHEISDKENGYFFISKKPLSTLYFKSRFRFFNLLISPLISPE
jgi:hypothetical protein